MEVDQRVVPAGLHRVLSHPPYASSLNRTVDHHLRPNLLEEAKRLLSACEVCLRSTRLHGLGTQLK